MPRDDSFKEFVVDSLMRLDAVRCKAMFGGHGFYLGDRFFGIIYRGRLYFRTDDRSRAAYVERGAQPFRPRTGQGLMMYYEVPADIVDDPDLLTEWARRAAATPRPGPRSLSARSSRSGGRRRTARSSGRRGRGRSGS
jgi:DNA transformation protein and related proteins